MAGRFQELFRLTSKLYLEGSPVLIEAGALQKDTQTGKVLAQIKLKNISLKNIIACKITIWAYEPNGAELEGVGSFSYLDINVSTGNDFGSKTPVYLPDNTTRKISVAVTEVVFADHTIWDSELAEWTQIPVQKAIVQKLQDAETVKQYEIEIGNDAAFYPELTRGLFLCTCGMVNLETSERCYKCKRKYENLMRVLDEASLTAKRDARLKKEQEEREAAELAAKQAAEEARLREEERKRKTKKVLSIVIPIIVVIAIIAALTPGVIKPAIDNAIAYHNANKLLESGSYDEAKIAFDALGTYRESETLSKESVYEKANSYLQNKQYDSATATYNLISDYLDSGDMAKEAQYQKADKLNGQGNYEDAIAVWSTISEYSDSTDRITTAEADWKEADYQAAQALMDAEKYTEASEAFDALGSYKDSVDKSAECIELQKEADYQSALAAVSAGDYKTALDTFKNLADYKDCSDLYVSTSYGYAVKLTEDSDYKNAITYFGYASGYEDADTLKTTAIYNYACQLLNDKNYKNAVTQFGKCSGYSDTASKVLDAKYGYVTGHKSNTDTTTYSYLKDLVAANYSGAKSIYNELYAWKITVTAINNSENSTSTMSSVSRYDKVYFHIKLTGGTPGGSTTVKFSGHMPGCSNNTDTFNNWSSGSSGYCCFYFNSGARAGTCSVTFYDGDGNVIGSASESVY